MSIYGAMLSGVSGLASQSQAMGMIADNISNVNTIGYKSTKAKFFTLVTEAATTSSYSPGGVKSTPYAMVDKQGLLQSSSSATDLAINGSGFFVVNTLSAPTATTGTYEFTRAGSFSPDQDGNLKNAAGLYLQGWEIDSSGNIPANRSDLTVLDTVSIRGLTGTAQATTAVSLQANLQSSQSVTLTKVSDTSSSFSTTATTVLGNGAGTGVVTGLTDLDSFSITNGSNSATFVYDSTPTSSQFSTLTELAALINATTGLSASITGTSSDATITVQGDDLDSSLVITNVVGSGGTELFGGSSPITTAAVYAPLTSATNMASGTITPDFQRSVQIVDSQGGNKTMTYSFLKNGIANEWQVEVHIEPASNALSSAHPDGIVAYGTMAFNTDGTWNASGTSLYDGTGSAISASSGDYSVTVQWDTSLGLADNTISLDFGTDASNDGLTQFDTASNLISSTVDGSIFGALKGVSVNEDGVVTALFDNGTKRDIYKLPIADFPNPNGLGSQNGNAYIQTDASGDFNLLESGIGGSGTVVPSSLESSTVDLAEEFSNMIVTQRAYSASGKIITTADEMLDELIRLKR